MTGIIWEGADASVWDMQHGPVRLIWIRGLGKVKTVQQTRETALTDGQTLLGVRRVARTVLMGVEVNPGLPKAEWAAWDKAWWQSLDAENAGTLHVTDEFGEVRHIALRFVDDGDLEFDRDPALVGITSAVVELVADQPYFLGDVVRYEVEPPPPPLDFFGPDGVGPLFFIESATTTDATIVANPGDTDVWAVWEQFGPSTAFSFTVAGEVLSGSVDVPDGSRLEIDTRPNRKTARLFAADGSWQDVFRQLDSFNFARIPKGQAVPVEIVGTGSGSIIVSFTPMYERGI